MLFNSAGQLVLIRNGYGRSDLFVLPGGGVRPFEEPAAAARREIREESGVALTGLEFRSRHCSTAEGKRDEIHLFQALVDGEVTKDDAEVQEACFANLDNLPSATSQATRRRIEEYLGCREPDGSW